MSTLAVNAHTPVDASGGAVSMALPTTAANGDEVSCEKYDTGANAVTITGNIRGTAGASITMTLPRETIGFRAKVTSGTTSWWPVFGHKTASTLVTKVPTATSGALGINTNPSNIIGPNADSYDVGQGEAGSPHKIGNARLPFIRGYDDHVWDNSIANHDTGFHCVTGGTQGHATVGGGSLHTILNGGYGTVGGGTRNKVLSSSSTIAGGSTNVAGANGVATLAAAIAVGDTSFSVVDATGLAVGQTVILGSGTSVLDASDGTGPLERAVITGISGTTITCGSFQTTATTDASGASTATAFSVARASGQAVLYTDGSKTGASIGGGFLNNAFGQYSTVTGGRENTASGLYSTAGGYKNTASGVGSTARGQYASAAWYGEHTTSANQGGQSSHIDVLATTTDGSTAVAVNGPGTGGSTYQLPRSTSAVMRGTLHARSADGANRFTLIFEKQCYFEATGNSGWDTDVTLRTVGTVPGTAGLSFSAGSSVGTVQVKVTGKASTTLQWTGRIDIVRNTL